VVAGTTNREVDLPISEYLASIRDKESLPVDHLFVADRPGEGLDWILISSMISGAPDQPWVWLLLISAGALLTLWQKR
jgi:hypothetical protein